MAPIQRFAALGGSIVLSLALAACGGGDDTAGTDLGMAPEASETGSAATTSSSDGAGVSAARNDADVAFTQMMIVHHRGAIDMAELAADRAESEQVIALAEQISAAQGPEIETMTSWLQVWGVTVPEGMSMEGMEGMEHEGMMMSGMMSEEQMARLQTAEGTEFDRMFLQLMTAHHQGAVEMSRVEQEEGENPEAIALAEDIEVSQRQEIEQMQELLQNL